MKLKSKFVALLSCLLLVSSCSSKYTSEVIPTSPSETGDSISDSEIISEQDSVSENISESESTSEITSKEDDGFEHEDYINSLKYGRTIKYANSMRNSVQNYYKSSSKGIYHIENSQIGLDYDMHGANKYITSIYSKENGNNYVTNTMNPYIVSGGTKYYASDSSTNARNNTYKFGYYYYDTHIMGQEFIDLADKMHNPVSLLNASIAGQNDIGNLTSSQNDGFAFDVLSNYDPYLCLRTNYLASDYNTLHVRIKTEYSTSFVIYMGSTTGGGIKGDQSLTVKGVNPGEFCDFYVQLDAINNYSGTITHLRIDVGSTVNEHIQIPAFEIFNADLDNGAFGLDRTFHTYGDRIYEEDNIVASRDNSTLEAYGYEIKINKNKVSKIFTVDENDTSRDTYVENTQYKGAAFLIKNTGVFGIILPNDKNYTLKVYLIDDYYVIDINSNIDKFQYTRLEKATLGMRIYTSTKNDFNGFLTEVYFEHNPLEIDLFKYSDNASPIGYDSTRGCYMYTVASEDFNSAYKNPQRQRKVNAQISSSENRKIYICTSANETGGLENGVVLSEDEQLLPIQCQVMKNFMGEHEEPFYDATDYWYGECLIPVETKAGDNLNLTIINLYEKWGQFRVKQLSSIQFYTEYYHLSCGTTESNCIAPESDNFLPDFRSMSAPYWSNQPQHTSYGSNVFTRYIDSSVNKQSTIHKEDDIDSSGPTYADVSLNYVSTDNKLKATYRHLEMPQEDENRTYYQLDYEVLDTLSISDFKNDFSIFSSFSRGVTYSQFGYLNSLNSATSITRDTATEFNDFFSLGKDYPYFDMYGATNSDDYVNLGILIKDYDVKINNQKIDTNFVVRSSFSPLTKNNQIDLSMNLDNVVFHKGDTMHFDIVLVPWGSQLTENDSNISALRENTLKNPYQSVVNIGKNISDTYMPKFVADNATQSAVFTVSDGAGLCSTRVYGFNKLANPSLEEYIDGSWVKYENNYYDYDGYNVYLDSDNTFSYSFNFDMGTGNQSRTFRVSVN